MKKRLVILFALLAVVVMLFAACGEGEEEHVHDFGKWIAEVDATCTQTGTVGHYHCAGCNKDFDMQKKEIADITIPVAAHTTGRLIAGTPATCTEEGIIDHYECAVCHQYLDAAKKVVSTIVAPATGHTVVVEAAIPATCTEDGLTEGRYCSVCGEVFAVQTVTLATGHSPVVDPAVAPNCLERGLTEGSHCENCGFVFKKQQVLKEGGHAYVWVDANPASCAAEGNVGHYHCEVCGKDFDENYEEITSTSVAMIPHTLGAWVSEVPPAPDATCLEPGTKGHYECLVCHKYFDAERKELTDLVIPSSGHVYGTWAEEIPAACGEDGVLAHYTCLLCGKHFDKELHEMESIVIPMPYPHDYEWVESYSTLDVTRKVSHYVCTTCGACFDENLVKIANSEDELRNAPIRISTVADLQELATRVQNGNSFAGKAFVLTADIDMSGVTFNGLGKPNSAPFSGSFDGQGHTITINQSITDPSGNGGLFAFVRVPENGTLTIKNLHVAGNIVLNNNSDNWWGYIGALVSGVDAGKTGEGGTFNLTNCWSTVRIDANKNRYFALSGLLAFIRHDNDLKPITVNIDSCLWDGVLNSGPALDMSGGLVGYTGNNKPGRLLVLNITNSVSVGTIMLNTSWTDRVGMILGYANGSNSDDPTAKVVVNVSNVVSTGKISFNTKNGPYSDNKIGQIATINGTTKLNLKNVYYYAFSRPANYSSPCPMIGNEVAPTSSSKVSALSLYKMVQLTGEDFTNASKWNTDYVGYPCPQGIVNTFGYPESLELDPYEIQDEFEIGTDDAMAAFAASVNSGKTYAGKTVKLTADVALNTTIGTTNSGSGNSFGGSFNGQGHTVTITQSIANPEDVNGGLFAFVRIPAGSAITIQNVHVTGTITLTNTTTNKGWSGGLIGTLDAGTSGTGGTINITNVWNTVRINGDLSNAWNYIGGMIGFTRHQDNLKPLTINMDSCVWDGVINSRTALYYSGGLIGYTGNNKSGRTLNINITNTVVAGHIMMNANWNVQGGLLMSYAKGSYSDAESAKVTVNISDVVATGKITNSTNHGDSKIGHIGIVDGTTEVNFTNYFYNAFDCKNLGSAAPVIASGTANTAINVLAKDKAGFLALTDSDFSDADKWTFEEECYPCPANIYETFGTIPASLNHSTTVKIGSDAEMAAFAADVNNGNTYEGKTVKLTADIDLTDSSWRSIGTRNNGDGAFAFRGTFDGQGHTVTLKSTSAAQSEGGLFGYLGDGAIVKNVKVTGKIELSTDIQVGYYGSVVGCATGTVQISNVWSNVNILTNAKWFKYSGGFIGGLENLKSANLTITDCVYSGTIFSNASVQESGGFFGYSGRLISTDTKTVTFVRCVFSGSFEVNTTQGYYEDTGLFMGYMQNNTNNTGKLTVSMTDCIVSGTFKFGEKANEINKNGACVIGWAGFYNAATSHTLNNVYYVPNNYPNESAVPAYNVTSGHSVSGQGATAKTLDEIKALTADNFTNGGAWTFVEGNTPVPSTIYNSFMAE